ncbi:MipA/OmpV family protein [Steroidobacter sp. S1-65]|uniref:MipA/OmpV family protein n=1 Tax=Steroidobacter gossypii TaxID=2805490 RepID=A0ABS1WSA7_9GAMM|nr:MipA/OmpV family protein [Steroidobacter gossypii]MBM0103849.1 MipA/OmpV family protein [Steroidobacter gossypii]
MGSMLKAALALTCAVIAWPNSSQAEQKPLWEAGLGVGAMAFPDYRGSDEVNAYPLPLPYFVYRGQFLKADREGLRGELFDQRYLELSLSMNATVPVSSDDNEAREGMPNLRPTLEFGPSLEVHLWRSSKEDMKLDLVMPLRLPITLEGSPQTLGWNFSPRLNLDIANIAGQAGWNFGIGVGPLFGAAEYHEYFYSVAPRFATAERAAYEANGGYSGTHVLAAISKRFPKYWVGAYMRYDNLHNAVFEDSPLVRQQNYVTGGIGIAWMIGKSKRMVEVGNDE